MMRLLLYLWLMSSTAIAATYYVRTDGHDGASGANNTTDETTGAWLTVQHAADTISAGNTAEIQAGAYAESVTINSGNGTAGNYKLFIANGAVTLQQIHIRDEYVWLSGLKVYSELTNTGILPGYDSGHSVISNCYVEVRGAGVKGNDSSFATAGDITVTHCTITNCGYGIIMASTGAVGWHVISNTIVRVRRWKSDGDCDYIRILSGGNQEIIGNLMYGANTNDIDMSVSDFPHSDNIQGFNSSIYWEAITNVVIAWNIGLDATTGINFDDVIRDCGNWTITNNVFGRGLPIFYDWPAHPKGYQPFYIDKLDLGLVMNNNDFFDYTNQGLIYRNAGVMALTNNIFRNCGTKGYFFNAASPQAVGDYNCTYTAWSDDKGANDINADPLFFDVSNPIGADLSPWTDDDGLRLTGSSPCIGVGFSGVDIGAYSYSDVLEPASVRARIGKAIIRRMRL